MEYRENRKYLKNNDKSGLERVQTNNPNGPIRQSNPAATVQRAETDPGSLTPADIMQLQKTVGNQAVLQLLDDMNRMDTVDAPVQMQRNIDQRNAQIAAINTAIAELQNDLQDPATRQQYQTHDALMGAGQHHRRRDASTQALIGDLERRIEDLTGFNDRDREEQQEANRQRVAQLTGIDRDVTD